MNRYVVEVERNGIRVLYGPVDKIQMARALSDQFLKGRRDEDKMVVRVRHLEEPPWRNLTPTNPNQTTIQDHIEDISNAMT